MQALRRRTLSRTSRPGAAEEAKPFPSVHPEDEASPNAAPAEAPSVSDAGSHRFRSRVYLHTRVTRPSHLRTMSLATALGATPYHASREDVAELDEKTALQEHTASAGTRRSTLLFPVQEHAIGSQPTDKPTSPIGRVRTRTRKMSLAMSAALRSASMRLHNEGIASFQMSPPKSPVQADLVEHDQAVPAPPDNPVASDTRDSSVPVGDSVAAADDHDDTPKSVGDDVPPTAMATAAGSIAAATYEAQAHAAMTEAATAKSVGGIAFPSIKPADGITFPTKEPPASALDLHGRTSQSSERKQDGSESLLASSRPSSPPHVPLRCDSPQPSLSASARRVRVWSIASKGSRPPRHSLLSGPSVAKPSMGSETGIAAAPMLGLQIGDVGGEFALPHDHHAGTTAVSAVASSEGKRQARLSSMATSVTRSNLHSPVHATFSADLPGHPADPLPDSTVGAGRFSLPLVQYHKKNTRFTMFQWDSAAEIEYGELGFVDGRVLLYSIFGKTSATTDPLLYLPDLLGEEPQQAVVPEPLRSVLEAGTRQLVLITTPRSVKNCLWPEPRELETLRSKLAIEQWSIVAATGTGIVPSLSYVQAFPSAAKALVAHDINLGHPGPHDLAAASISSGDAWADLRSALCLPPTDEGVTIPIQEYDTVLRATALQLQSVTDDTRPAMVNLARAWNSWQRAQGQVLNLSSDEDHLTSATHSVDVLTRLPTVSINQVPIASTLVQARHDTICTPRSLACIKDHVRIVDGAVRASHLTAEAFIQAVLDQLKQLSSSATAQGATAEQVISEAQE